MKSASRWFHYTDVMLMHGQQIIKFVLNVITKDGSKSISAFGCFISFLPYFLVRWEEGNSHITVEKC
jgi:hypothetical protein